MPRADGHIGLADIRWLASAIARAAEWFDEEIRRGPRYVLKSARLSRPDKPGDRRAWHLKSNGEWILADGPPLKNGRRRTERYERYGEPPEVIDLLASYGLVVDSERCGLRECPHCAGTAATGLKLMEAEGNRLLAACGNCGAVYEVFQPGTEAPAKRPDRKRRRPVPARPPTGATLKIVTRNGVRTP